MNGIKKIEELGISPAPWNEYKSSVYDANKKLMMMFAEHLEAERAAAKLVSAAPDLYDCLREAVCEMCHDCPRNNHDSREECDQCFVQRWRDALAKAAGGAK